MGLGKALRFLLRSSPKVSLFAGEMKSALDASGWPGQTNGAVDQPLAQKIVQDWRGLQPSISPTLVLETPFSAVTEDDQEHSLVFLGKCLCLF
jgi:hypothetical protein